MPAVSWVSRKLFCLSYQCNNCIRAKQSWRVNKHMKIREVVAGLTEDLGADPDLELDDKEIRQIQQQKRRAAMPKVKDMLYTTMPGNTSTYPFQ